MSGWRRAHGPTRSALLWMGLAGMLLGLCGAVHAGTRDPALALAAGVEDLGGGRYRIGAIDIDQKAGRFTVPGTVLDIDTEAMPIEFLAVTKGALKAYEATLELDAEAVAFNVACLLIGLDPARATLPAYHFDPAVLEGDAVDLGVRWEADGEVHESPLGELLENRNGPVSHDWVYVGSGFMANGSYMAEYYGTLIGVVHDPESILQHRTGLGLGDYGAVTANPERMPSAGTAVVVTVSRRVPAEMSKNFTDP